MMEINKLPQLLDNGKINLNMQLRRSTHQIDSGNNNNKEYYYIVMQRLGTTLWDMKHLFKGKIQLCLQIGI